MKVSILVYKHRHGEDVSVYATPELARAAAVGIIEEYIAEVVPEAARERIAALIAAGKVDEALEAWDDAQSGCVDPERIEISEDVEVQSKAPTAAKPCCPKCGDDEHLTITEGFTAYHPVRVEDGRMLITNALGATCPSEHFDDGDECHRAYCRNCSHEGPVEEFGLSWDGSDWE